MAESSEYRQGNPHDNSNQSQGDLPRFRRCQIKDIPKELLDGLPEKFWPYSVGLVGLCRGREKDQCCLLGSGTLIQVGDVKGILTAQHVVASDQFAKSELIGLVFMAEGVQRLTVKREYLQVVVVAKPVEVEEGPDLAVIIPPADKLGWLEAKGQFWNISRWRQKLSSGFSEVDTGIWYVCGFPNELTLPSEPDRGFHEVISFCNLASYTGVTREWTVGEYDYLELSVFYEENSKLPKSFGGVSGAGIWHIQLTELSNMGIAAEEPVLSGVAFFETPPENNERAIRCHGRRSVYDHVFVALTE
ncbi:MAG: hypothetical protein KAT58_02405 [candidate division Zixibacteria bacterium]|nr:hypothetical protein [candidate division Zixibacteria bacterium]